jgi:hypothetical protein
LDFETLRGIFSQSQNKLSNTQNIEKLTIAEYFNITEKQLKELVATRAGTTSKIAEQAIHINGQPLTLLIIYKRKKPKLVRK